jgi:hypothetical protein
VATTGNVTNSLASAARFLRSSQKPIWDWEAPPRSWPTLSTMGPVAQ